MKIYTVIKVDEKEARVHSGNVTITIKNEGYIVGQKVLFDGSTVKVLPNETTVINI